MTIVFSPIDNVFRYEQFGWYDKKTKLPLITVQWIDYSNPESGFRVDVHVPNFHGSSGHQHHPEKKDPEGDRNLSEWGIKPKSWWTESQRETIGPFFFTLKNQLTKRTETGEKNQPPISILFLWNSDLESLLLIEILNNSDPKSESVFHCHFHLRQDIFDQKKSDLHPTAFRQKPQKKMIYSQPETMSFRDYDDLVRRCSLKN